MNELYIRIYISVYVCFVFAQCSALNGSTCRTYMLNEDCGTSQWWTTIKTTGKSIGGLRVDHPSTHRVGWSIEFGQNTKSRAFKWLYIYLMGCIQVFKCFPQSNGELSCAPRNSLTDRVLSVYELIG